MLNNASGEYLRPVSNCKLQLNKAEDGSEGTTGRVSPVEKKNVKRSFDDKQKSK